MSETEEQDFIVEYLTWMKGPELDQESLHVYNFGYERTLPFPTIAVDTRSRLNLQTSGMQTPSRWSIVVIGEKYVGRFHSIMSTIERIHEDTQALPFVIFVQTSDEINFQITSSNITPALVGIYLINIMIM